MSQRGGEREVASSGQEGKNEDLFLLLTSFSNQMSLWLLPLSEGPL